MIYIIGDDGKQHPSCFVRHVPTRPAGKLVKIWGEATFTLPHYPIHREPPLIVPWQIKRLRAELTKLLMKLMWAETVFRNPRVFPRLDF